MKRGNIFYLIACVILVLAIFYCKEIHKEVRVPSSKQIRLLPFEIKGFMGKEDSPSYINYHDPSADEQVIRIYSKRSFNKPIRVFVGYWEYQSDVKKIRPPRYTTDQWGYYWIKTVSLPIGSEMFSLKKFLNERGQEKELVYYCYIMDKGVCSSEYALRFFSMLNKLFAGKNNATVLRVSSPITEDWPIEKAQMYEEEFIREIIPLLLEYM